MGDEDKTVLDLAVEALNRIADKLGEMNEILYMMGYVETEMSKSLVAVDEDLKTLIENFASAKEIAVSQPEQGEQQPLRFGKPFVTKV